VYEGEVASNPILGVVTGELIQAFLIQVQKLKADVEEEMVGIDRLLRANELNLQIMATVPALIIASAGFIYARRLYRRWRRLGKGNPPREARAHLRR
jgi:hypothetical protein